MVSSGLGVCVLTSVSVVFPQGLVCVQALIAVF